MSASHSQSGRQGDADELRRQRRLVDQTATMQSALRDRYAAQARGIRICQLVLSVVATAFAFASGGVEVSILGVSADRTTWLGWLAVGILSLAVVDLVYDRSGHAGRHDSAVRQLSVLKSGYRVDPEPDDLASHLREMTERYETTMDGIPPIPERHFLPLKARHLTKVEVSRYLSAHPGMGARRARRAVREGAMKSHEDPAEPA